MQRIAPNLDPFLWRPVLADPPLYSMRDLTMWVTIADVLDAHEALDLIAATVERSKTT